MDGVENNSPLPHSPPPLPTLRELNPLIRQSMSAHDSTESR
jgi:hypothetical protein